MTDSRKKTPVPLIAAAWVLVLIPLSWGVMQSVLKSLPLFQQAGPSRSSKG